MRRWASRSTRFTPGRIMEVLTGIHTLLFVVAVVWIVLMAMALSGCEEEDIVIPQESVPGGRVEYRVYDDAQALADACGPLDTRACSWVTNHLCIIHVGSRQPQWVIRHEERHCAGQKGIDRPTVGGWK